MTKQEIKTILQTIDISYQTHFVEDEAIANDWQKDLKNYDFEDVNNKLIEHMKSNFQNIPPKKYYLLNGLYTTKDKEKLKGIKIECDLCKGYFKLEDYDSHRNRCHKIYFIQYNARKYLNQEIDLEKYKRMSDEELNTYHIAMSKKVLNETDDPRLKRNIKHYLEGVKE